MYNNYEESNLKKYTKQITSAEARNIKGKKTTLSIDQELYVPKADDSPMKMFADYSRFKVAVMNNNNPEGIMKNPVANLLVSEIPYIYQHTLWCNKKYWDLQWEKACGCGNTNETDTEQPTGLAYTVKLAGKMAGKTAAQVLTEKGDEGKKQLSAQSEWLSKNLSGRYAASNKEQIDAINEAISLYNRGQLKKTNMDNVYPQILVNEPVKKYFREKKEINGEIYNKCYEIRITFDAGRNYPYTVAVQNSYCSVQSAPGQTSRIGNENLEPSYGEIKLTVSQWLKFIEVMHNRILEHEVTHYREQERIMDENAWKPAEEK